MPITRSATVATTSATKPPASPMRPAVKRSASIASLPTPPRTLHKRRGRKASGAAPIAEEAEDDELPSLAPPPAHATRSTGPAPPVVEVKHGRKRTRPDVPLVVVEEEDEEDEPTANPDAEAAEEDAFWLDEPSPAKAGPSTRRSRAPEPPSPRGLLDQPGRIKVRAPVSPPPSRHRPARAPVTPKAVVGTLPVVAAAAPVTPPPKRTLRSAGPVRDSPSNPFLDAGDEDDEPLTLSRPSTPTPYAEPPVLTYVFRGTRALVANPHFRKNPEAEARARLPEIHPDYEPLEACAPKRLFATEVAAARRNQPRRAATSTKPAPRTPSPTRAVKAEPSTPRIPRTPTAALTRALGPVRGGKR